VSSLTIIIEFAALLIILGLGIAVVYAIFEMREVYADHRDKFLKGITAVEQLQKMQPEVAAVLERVQTDSKALQKLAVQIEVAVAAMRTGMRSQMPVIRTAPEPENNVQDRFSQLKEWIETNEVTLELFPDNLLIIGMRGHDKKITIPLADLVPRD
jgi:uncharacterized protein HemX